MQILLDFIIVSGVVSLLLLFPTSSESHISPLLYNMRYTLNCSETWLFDKLEEFKIAVLGRFNEEAAI
jgi:hypothetical protein